MLFIRHLSWKVRDKTHKICSWKNLVFLSYHIFQRTCLLLFIKEILQECLEVENEKKLTPNWKFQWPPDLNEIDICPSPKISSLFSHEKLNLTWIFIGSTMGAEENGR